MNKPVHEEGPSPEGDPADQISVALIEDNRMVMDGLTLLLGRIPDLRIVASAAKGNQMGQIKRANPSVILLDQGFEDEDGVALVEHLVQSLPKCGIIVMDLLPVHEDIVDFIAAGVSGFVTKDATLDDLTETIRSVAGGLKVLPDLLTGTLFSEIAKEAVTTGVPRADDSVRLTPRERDVIQLIADGMSNKAIAKELHLSTHTIKSHLRNIMEKLTLHSRLEIAAYVHKKEVGS